MLSNMACSLIEHKRINTTVAKAKELRKFVEPLINRSKEDSTHSRRVCFSYLKNKHAVTELFREVAPKVSDRQGGYTRIIRTGFRLGDSADMCLIELVDFNDIYGREEKKTKTRRSRRGGAAKPKADAPATEVKEEEAPATEAPEKEAKAEKASTEEAPKKEDASEAKADDSSKEGETSDDEKKD